MRVRATRAAEPICFARWVSIAARTGCARRVRPLRLTRQALIGHHWVAAQLGMVHWGGTRWRLDMDWTRPLQRVRQKGRLSPWGCSSSPTPDPAFRRSSPVSGLGIGDRRWASYAPLRPTTHIRIHASPRPNLLLDCQRHLASIVLLERRSGRFHSSIDRLRGRIDNACAT